MRRLLSTSNESNVSCGLRCQRNAAETQVQQQRPPKCRHARSRLVSQAYHEQQGSVQASAAAKRNLLEQQVSQKLARFASRRALLVSIGISPLLTSQVLPISAQAADTLSSEGREASEGSPLASQQPEASSDGSIGSPGGSEDSPGPSSADGSSDAAGQQQQEDDSPSEAFDDADSSSSSDSDSSSSSSEGEEDSSSDEDEEPGELFASNDDNNNAAGSSSSSGGSTGDSASSSRGSSSGSSPTVDTADAASSGTKAAERTVIGSNLSVPSYIQILQDSRRSSWPMLAQKIQTKEWIELSQLLVQPPFDAVRQACFYIPWALLQSDEPIAAVAARKAYVDYIDHVHAFAAIALKAADDVPGADVQVQQAFTLMNASLNAFLSAVPLQYQRYRI